MNLNNKTINELLNIAYRTTSLEEMTILLKNSSMNVRRALARNINITEEILSTLLQDPVQNVGYMANLHPKNAMRKEYGNVRPCVSCSISEHNLDCVGCEKIRS